MNYRKTLFFNTLGLPAYWGDCRRARSGMECEECMVKYGKAARQYAMVIRGPATVPGRYAFYFHGGAWTFGRPETFIPAATPWLEQGFTVILPSYRRPPTVGLHGVVADCRDALAALAPGEDVTHLHVGGISAGAHLAALLALQPDWWRAAGWSLAPQKALLCAGPLVLTDLWPALLFRRYGEFDPAALLPMTAARPQWQLLHGRHDAMVPYAHSRKFYDQLVAQGQTADLLTLAEGTHLDSGRWMFGGVGAKEVSTFLSRA